jgi:hypothetical protein
VPIKNVEKTIPDKLPRFGQIALEKGFVTSDHLKKALTEQINKDFSGKSSPCRRIGEILFEKGWIRNKHIDIVLKEQLKADPSERAQEDISFEKKREIARSAGIILPGMTKREVREIFGSMQPRIWYTPREQEVWYYNIPQKQNIYFVEDKVEKIKYIQ